ncbi:hypothetical protein DMB95_01090 [Campylobacter sp. MIT 12-8780]|uniref:hypothetical protein n=1 Tax=unclassified Campylobacter TaxID=2593542 RepID=UPI00115C5E4B|nr:MULTISPECIES: hypothetical protein [unclassified Campylobacter]NDJ26556.1 hypothetical protein [Campylobacter sp. MIT 19-121]TQR43126.1 hypothetical protein DMB95_01090 [Campylobacter sp. MIT 12-8780]
MSNSTMQPKGSIFSMRKIAKFFALATLGIGISACSTIINGTTQKMTFESNPSSASIEIKTSGGISIGKYTTPASVTLERGRGYFTPQEYKVLVSKPGYKDVEFNITHRVSGWYIAGNLIFGGLLGWLVVDPITGAVYILEAEGSNITSDGDTITISLLEELSLEQQSKLQRIN